MLFSQRRGLKPIKNIIQTDSLDEETRNGLWSALTVWRNHHQVGSTNDLYIQLMKDFWLNYFKKPLDALSDANTVYAQLRNMFLGGGAWNECFDILEFIVSSYPDNDYRKELIKSC